jgi:formylmethanofuran dehydrogenase subunit E
MKKEFQPTKVQSYFCSKCRELMLKNYPNSTFKIEIKGGLLCKKCLSKNETKNP